MLTALDRFFNRTITKFILAFLIIVSVLPLPEVRRFDLVFFCIFGVELVVRIILLARAGKKSTIEMIMIGIDTVAVLSFLPIPHQLVETRYLRLIRLVRLSLLLRFAASLARDMWNILSRKEIKYQLGFLLGAVLILTFLSGIVLHALQVPVDIDNDGTVESGTLKDVLWWSFREVESQDNIAQNLDGSFVFSSVSIFLTLAGVFIMSLIIGIGASVVEELLSASREKPVALGRHTIVIGRGRNLRHILEELVRIMRKNREKPGIALLSEAAEPPSYLYEQELRKVEYRSGDSTELRSLRLVNLGEAEKTLILYDDEKKQLADAYSISTVLAVREESDAPIYLELRDDGNMQAAMDAGGGGLTAIPMGTFLGTLLCQNLIFPGMDRVFEELVTSRGSEIYTSFFSDRELERLRGREEHIDFKELLLHCYREYGVILLGVFLDVEGRNVPWLNPLGSTGEVRGVRKGFVPPDRLSGLVGLGRERKHLDRARSHVVSGEAPGGGAKPVGLEMDYGLSESMTSLRHVMVIGENENLPALIRETTKFVSRIEFTVIIPGKERGESVRHALKDLLGCTVESCEDRDSLWSRARLEGDHHLTVLSCDEDIAGMLTDRDLWEAKNFDAAVFLSDVGAVDPDAQSLLWLFKMMELIEQGTIKVSAGFHVLAEISVSAKGELVEKRFVRPERRMVRAISTRRIRNYFMAQSSFVPCIWDVYRELLASEGEDFCQLSLKEAEGNTAFSELLAFFAERGLILFGVGTGRQGDPSPTVVNPRAGSEREELDLGLVRNLYVIGDTDRILRTRGSRSSIAPRGR